MVEPKSSHPYWPDALSKPTDSASLKPWSWALERLEKSHNYWIATSRSDGQPHLMVVWGIWWQENRFGSVQGVKRAKQKISPATLAASSELKKPMKP